MKPKPVSVPLTTLAAARQRRDLSQAALGKLLGIPQSQISRIERGLADPQLATLQNLAGALDLELALVPRELGPVIGALVADFTQARTSTVPATQEDRPLYQLPDEQSPDAAAAHRDVD